MPAELLLQAVLSFPAIHVAENITIDGHALPLLWGKMLCPEARRKPVSTETNNNRASPPNLPRLPQRGRNGQFSGIIRY
jgi:hypothetical protein